MRKTLSSPISKADGARCSSSTSVRPGLRTYTSLPHRMQRVRERDGVLFINDSKATNAASTAPALAARPAIDGKPRIHWILGGLAKSDDLDECAPDSRHVAHAYTIGEAGPLFARLLREAGIAVTECELLVTRLPKRRQGQRPAMSCCCRRLARRSTSFAISRREVTRSRLRSRRWARRQIRRVA